MARTMYYSKKYNELKANNEEAGGEGPVLTKVPTRQLAKMVPLLMLACLMVALVCVLLVPLMVGGAAPAASKEATSRAMQVESVAYTSPEHAMQVLNIQPTLPAALPEGYSVVASRVLNGNILEIEYGGKNTILLRCAVGSEDLSGADYDTLGYTLTETVGDITRGYAGVSEKKFSSAAWVNGEYTYAVVADGGMEAAALKQFAELVA